MPTESDSIRARRLEIARDEAIAMKLGSDHLIGVATPEVDGATEPKVISPMESACYDALLYLREGMSRDEVINMIMMRNRINKADTEKIVDHVIESSY